MKYIFTLITLLGLAVSWTSCKKVETDPNALDYYKNKNIILTISSEDFDDGDMVSIKISAVRVGDKWAPNPKILIDGHEVEGEYGVITSDHISNGSVTITATDKAWQFVAEYTVATNGTPFTLVWNSTFDDVAQEPIKLEVLSPISKNGLIEIKEYKNK